MCYVKYYASSLGILVSTASMMIFTAGRMIPAIMSLFMRVMAALYVWIILQFFVKQRFYRSIRITRYSAIKFNTDLGESCPRAASDATTDQYIRFQSRKYSCECAMPALRGIYDLASCNFSIIHIIYF